MRLESSLAEWAEVRVSLRDGVLAELGGPGNLGERTLGSLLVREIHNLAQMDGDAAAADVLEEVSDGPAKMLHVFGDDDRSLLGFGYTPRPTLVARADLERLCDDAGKVAAADTGVGRGIIAPELRTPMLNKVVTEFFDRICALIDETHPAQVLEILAIEQEALIFMQLRAEVFLPSRTACFGPDSRCVREALEEADSLTATAMANRFVLECITARPPSGDLPLSAHRHAQMLALAKEIVEYGYLSDAIQYGLSDPDMEILASGRIGYDRSQAFDQAIRAYRAELAARRPLVAERRYARNWRGAGATAEIDVSDFNLAFEAEFGLSAESFAAVVGELAEMARQEDSGVRVQELSSLELELAGRLQLSLETASGYPPAQPGSPRSIPERRRSLPMEILARSIGRKKAAQHQDHCSWSRGGRLGSALDLRGWPLSSRPDRVCAAQGELQRDEEVHHPGASVCEQRFQSLGGRAIPFCRSAST